MAHLINNNDLKEEAGNIGNWAWNTWLGNEMNNLVGDNPYLNILGLLGLNVTNTILNNVALLKLSPTNLNFSYNNANKLLTNLNFSDYIKNTTLLTPPNLIQNNNLTTVSVNQNLLNLLKSVGNNNLNLNTLQQNTTQSNNINSNLINGAIGSVAGTGASMLTNYLASKALGNSKGAQMISGTLGQGAGTAAGAVVSNALAGTAGTTTTNALNSAFSSASGLAAGGMGVANLALDVFDPVKKSKIESGANIAAGVGGLAATTAIPAAGPFIAAAILAANAVGHLAGLKTENFTANRELLAQAGSSYNSSVNNILKAESLAGQKYSGYNSGGRHKADKAIYTGSQEQEGLEKVLSNIGSLRDILTSTAGLVSQLKELESNGGPQSVYIGKEGTILNKISYIDEAPSYIDEAPTIIEEFQEGGQLDKDESYKWTIDYAKSKNLNWIKRWLDPNRATIPDWKVKNLIATHKLSYSQKNIDGKEVFVVYPEVQEINGSLYDFTDPKNKKDWQDALNNAFQNHELLIFEEEGPAEWFTEHYKEYAPSFLKYKEGGSFNIIPEGALHARLHHMEDTDNLTKKGIPVVDNNGELQAEIERQELILRLSVTKHLEELAKEGTDQAAIEAGKLLVNEILYNTVDNTI